MTTLRRCTSVLLLISDEDALHGVFETASNHDFDVHMPGVLADAEASRYENILATVDNLRYCKEVRDRVVVVLPQMKHIKTLLKAGYKRFLFNPSNEAEAFVSLMALGGEDVSAPATRIGKILADFSRRRYTIDGNEIYLSKGELKFLFDKYVLRKSEPSGSAWRIHRCRIRKRFGKDVFEE
jgi:hypothetical protein